MDADILCAEHSFPITTVEDPLGHDMGDDVVVTTTRRAISRVAFVAAETASRFEREMIDHDPVAWMMAPRRLFEGAAALDACLGRDAFLRASLLHGLSIGLDASPDEIDLLLEDDGVDFPDDGLASDDGFLLPSHEQDVGRADGGVGQAIVRERRPPLVPDAFSEEATTSSAEMIRAGEGLARRPGSTCVMHVTRRDRAAPKAIAVTRGVGRLKGWGILTSPTKGALRRAA